MITIVYKVGIIRSQPSIYKENDLFS